MLILINKALVREVRHGLRGGHRDRIAETLEVKVVAGVHVTRAVILTLARDSLLAHL